MRYLKLFENKEEELRELIPELDDLCQDLTDHGFRIEYWLSDKRLVDFPEDETRIPGDYITDYMHSEFICMLSIEINKYDKHFYIDDTLINNLLFIESYSEEELNLKVNYYDYYQDDCDHYCKNIKDLTRIGKVSTITISFSKA